MLVLAAALPGCGPGTPPPKPVPPPQQPQAERPRLVGKPHVRIELGMHTTSVKDADADAAGTLLATASDDKTVRLWSLPGGALRRTLRLPIDGVDGGKAYAVAVSPDGARITAGGYSETLFIYDAGSGALLQRLDGLPDSVISLDYSRDGQWLAAGYGSGGIQIFKTGPRYRAHARDTDYRGSVYGLDFDSQGRLATADTARTVRRYGAPVASAPIPSATGAPVTGAPDKGMHDTAIRPEVERQFDELFLRLAISPDDSTIALGSLEGPRVSLVSADDLTIKPGFNLGAYDRGNLTNVAWLDDNKPIAGGEFDIDGYSPVVMLNDDEHAFWNGGHDSVGALVPLPGGQLATAMMDPRVLLFGPDGKIRWMHQLDKLDMRAVPLAVSPNGLSVTIASYPRDDSPLPPLHVHIGRGEATEHHLPVTEAPELEVTNWDDDEHPRLNGMPLALKNKEVSRALAIAHSQDRFVLGTEWYLRMYDKQGTPLWSEPMPSVAWAVNISRDDRLVVAATDDGRLQWHDAKTGKLLLSHFQTRDGRWVRWMPEGFFSASAPVTLVDPGGSARERKSGDAMIGYQISRGPNHAPAFIRASQLYSVFYRPNLILSSLHDDRSAITDAVAKHGDIDSLVKSGLPPSIEILSVKPVDNGEHEVRFRVIDRGGGVGNIHVLVNDKNYPLAATRAHEVKGPNPVRKTRLTLPQGKTLLTLLVENQAHNILSSPARKVIDVKKRPAKPALHFVAIAISDYKAPKLKKGVEHAKEDAKALRQQLKKATRRQRDKHRIYTRFAIPMIITSGNRKTILKRFSDAMKRVHPDDTVVFYVAGHGQSHNGLYYFLTPSVQYGVTPDKQKHLTLDDATLANMIGQIPALNALIVLDTCHAGAALTKITQQGIDIATKQVLMQRVRRHFIAGSRANNNATQLFKHSPIVKAMLESLGGKGDKWDEFGLIDSSELIEYVVRRVPKMTAKLYNFEQIVERFNPPRSEFPLFYTP